MRKAHVSDANIPAGVIFAKAGDIEDLRAQAEELTTEAEALIALADEEDRDLSDEENETIVANAAKVEKLRAKISALETFKPQSRGRATSPEPKNRGGSNRVETKMQDDPKFGFKNFGEFAMTVRGERDSRNPHDDRLKAVATTYGNEGTGADGGFAVPTEWRREIWGKVMGEDSLLARCASIQTAANSITLPKNEDTPWSSNGVRVYWEGEADAVSASKPVLKTDTIRLNKLMAMVPMTEELLDDAPGMESWLRAWAPQKMTAALNTAILSGTGAGQPLGILNSGALITVDAESGQAADTVVYNNIVNMWGRLYAPCRRNAVWLVNQDVEPQLMKMQFGTSGTAVPAYLPPGGLSAAPYGTLMNRPVVPVEASPTVGDVGDITLVDLTQYMALTKAGQDVQTDVSMHLYFDQALQAFRFIFRVAGQPMWSTAIDRQNGSNTLSFAVALAARAG